MIGVGMRLLIILFLVTWSGLVIWPGASVAHGSDKARSGLCNDYGSKKDYMGNRYHVVDPEDGRVVRQHWAIDFCTKTGTAVLAPADGWVEWIVWDNPVRGGSVMFSAILKGADAGAPAELTYLRALHIDPDPKLRPHMRVQAGMVIGKTQKGGKVQIGPQSHVHFDMGKCHETWLCGINPHPYWSNGPNKITCFDAKAPPSKFKIVVPLACRP